MTSARMAAIGIVLALLGPSLLSAGDLAPYRGLQFGMNIATAARQAGANPSEVRLVQQRPALIQDLEWRPLSRYQLEPVSSDPVAEGLLRFYAGELFQVVVTYDRYKVQGMTTDDMVQAISRTYGTATRPTAQIGYHSNYGEVAQVLARWEDPHSAYNLVQTGDQSSFALILCSKRLDGLAQASIVEAARLDALDAPRRALDLLKQQDAQNRLALDKARATNRTNFRP